MHSRFSFLNKWMCFILCKMVPPTLCQLGKFILDAENEVLFPMASANSIQVLHLLSTALYKRWHCVSNESDLVWQIDLKCYVHGAWAKIWSGKFLITVSSTLFNFPLHLECCVPRESQSPQDRTDTDNRRMSSEGPPRQGARGVQGGSRCCSAGGRDGVGAFSFWFLQLASGGL